jgi:hypothetical protein
MIIKSSFWVLMLWCKTGNSVMQGMMMKAQIFPPLSHHYLLDAMFNLQLLQPSIPIL